MLRKFGVIIIVLKRIGMFFKSFLEDVASLSRIFFPQLLHVSWYTPLFETVSLFWFSFLEDSEEKFWF
jgi:hypothetical protein